MPRTVFAEVAFAGKVRNPVCRKEALTPKGASKARKTRMLDARDLNSDREQFEYLRFKAGRKTEMKERITPTRKTLPQGKRSIC
jgi:hypothetical protein